MSIVIVDTGVANLASVMFAFERLKVAPVVSQDPAVIAAAERIIIPGVGAAPAAMQKDVSFTPNAVVKLARAYCLIF